MSIPTNDVLDLLIVGGGPAGTAAAFRARELGLKTFLIDFDDVLKRIRDYPKDKLILPDFGGGDRMAFPAGGDCVSALQFEPIDKDEICSRWKGLYQQFDIPSQTALELSSVERDGDAWKVTTWDHKGGEQRVLRSRHVALAIGRGVPRKLEMSGNTDGIKYRLDDPAKYVNGPVLVIGGGTSAAEAVLSISGVKIEADEASPVYWSFRGTKMPRVSKALAERFFEAFVANGNIRSLPDSEPVSVVTTPDRSEMVSLRTDRKHGPDRPPETVHLEFSKTNCIACIGEDIPEKLLKSLGISMVDTGGEDGKKMLVSPLLETQQPNMYLIGDLLSQSYLETDDFSAPADAYRKVKHRGNIKTSLRDGVFIAEVVKQRLDGKKDVKVVMNDAAPRKSVSVLAAVTSDLAEAAAQSPADVTPADLSGGRLVLLTQAGVEADEFRLNANGATTIGRAGCDINFAQDSYLSDAHASIISRDGDYYLRDDGSRAGTYLRVRPDHPMKLRDGDFIRAGRQILVLWHKVPTAAPQLEHYDASGAQVDVYSLSATKVFGRSGGSFQPDIVLDDSDGTLSRHHFAIGVELDAISVSDFNSRNGTYLKVDDQRKLEQGDVIRIGTQQLVVRLREDLPEKVDSKPVVAAPPQAAEAQVAAAPAPAPSVSGGAPHITFAGQNKAGPIDPSKTLLAWADDNEVSIDYECWAGMCGCDAIKVVSGAEHLSPVTEKEIKTLKRRGLEAGPCRLACMTKCSGPVVVEVVK